MPTTWQTMHIQGRPHNSAVATIAQWLIAQGRVPRSMSDLVNMTFETLAASIVDAGGTPVFDEGAGAILSQIGREARPGAVPLASPGDAADFASEELARAFALFTERAQKKNADASSDVLRDGIRAHLRREEPTL